VFRIAPTDHGTAFRLAEHLIPKGLKIGLVVDDSSYGQEGAKALGEAFARNEEAVAIKLTVPTDSADLAPEVLRARRAGATALLVWAQPTTIAGVLTAARSSGWEVPVYTPATGEDPLVRQQLANRPEWVDGLTFAAGRPTAEVGPGPFLAFQQKYEQRFGVQLVGVKTPDGAEVAQPPDYAMYSYDCGNVLAAAIERAGGADDKERVLEALEQVSVTGANGDQRGFNENNHDGVIDDDVYFARFEGMTYQPVKDDPLSATLATIDQRR
jgi:ABC-type branched-subunit amino acid transport system substrate-binding protein